MVKAGGCSSKIWNDRLWPIQINTNPLYIINKGLSMFIRVSLVCHYGHELMASLNVQTHWCLKRPSAQPSRQCLKKAAVETPNVGLLPTPQRLPKTMGKLGKESGKMTIFTTSGHSGILNLEREREGTSCYQKWCAYIYIIIIIINNNIHLIFC